VEAWLLADHERIARYLRISESRVPVAPEALPDAKRTLVNLARRSRSASVREDFVPHAGRSATVGPLYTARLIEFTERYWRPEVAATASPSLDRALRSLRALAAELEAL